ncbi:MAG TPA: ATP-binding protein, partial [Kofleriaceae bacterium]|nr:ATP-binding protein [Kofleriaceae bacterium]
RLSGVGFWYCDLPFDELQWDAQVKHHFFLPPDARVTIETFYDRMHPADRDRTRAAIDTSIAEHGSYDIIYRTVEPGTGSLKFIRALGGTAYAIDGTPLRFDGVTVDVTTQKREEERNARVAKAALAIHSANTLGAVLHLLTDEVRTLIGVRDAEARLGDDAPVRPFESKRSLVVPLVGRSGAQLGVIELHEKLDGELTGADEAIVVQLAQLAAVALENTKLNDELREEDRRKDEFLATLAHELRNPLAPIRTGIQLLQHAEHAPAVERLLSTMDRQLGHLVRMVDDLLDISRVTLGKISLQKEPVDLRAVIESALETTRSLIEARGQELAVRLPDTPLPLDVDPTRLSQVFANLLNNAAKYTPTGGRIAVTAELHDTALVVRVSDTGIGIPREMLPRIFDMFTQVARSLDRTSALGGLGIGLTLVRRLVELHGGTVVAESAGDGQGSSFIVRLPRGTSAVLARPAPPPSAAATSGLRILVVDDNVDAAETLAMLLELSGNETRLAHDGPEALAAVPEFRPDVVFLDIGLPQMNGYEVASRLRADPSIAQPVLVALTGWGSEEDRKQAHAAGFDRHLVKPIDSAKIEDVLGAVANDR